MPALSNKDLWLRYKPNGTGNSGTTATLGGSNERRITLAALSLHQAAAAVNALLPDGTDKTNVLNALDTAISSLHTGSATISNKAGD